MTYTIHTKNSNINAVGTASNIKSAKKIANEIKQLITRGKVIITTVLDDHLATVHYEF